MRNTGRTLSLIRALLVFAFFSGAAHADQAGVTTATDWVSLFDGKSLDGWTQVGGSAPYRVEDGAIIGTSVMNSPNSFLRTDQTFKNFILEFDFKIAANMNSGVQFRSLLDPNEDPARVRGYQFELDPSARAWTAGIYDEARRGWLYPLTQHPDAQQVLAPGRWYTGRIECRGSDIRTYLNGVAVAHLIDDPEIPQQGFIALQVHSIGNEDQAGLEIHWRNIRIRSEPLPLDAPSEPSPPLVDLRPISQAAK